MSKLDYQCTFNLQDCIEKLGLEEKGRVQKFVTNEFKKNVEPYVPFDVAGKYEQPGRLKDSVHIENDTEIVWETPYARHLYHHPEYDFQDEPMRGGYWASRYLQDGGLKQLEDGARKEAGK